MLLYITALSQFKHFTFLFGKSQNTCPPSESINSCFFNFLYSPYLLLKHKQESNIFIFQEIKSETEGVYTILVYISVVYVLIQKKKCLLFMHVILHTHI